MRESSDDRQADKDNLVRGSGDLVERHTQRAARRLRDESFAEREKKRNNEPRVRRGDDVAARG